MFSVAAPKWKHAVWTALGELRTCLNSAEGKSQASCAHKKELKKSPQRRQKLPWTCTPSVQKTFARQAYWNLQCPNSPRQRCANFVTSTLYSLDPLAPCSTNVGAMIKYLNLSTCFNARDSNSSEITLKTIHQISPYPAHGVETRLKRKTNGWKRWNCNATFLEAQHKAREEWFIMKSHTVTLAQHPRVIHSSCDLHRTCYLQNFKVRASGPDPVDPHFCYEMQPVLVLIPTYINILIDLCHLVGNQSKGFGREC